MTDIIVGFFPGETEPTIINGHWKLLNLTIVISFHHVQNFEAASYEDTISYESYTTISGTTWGQEYSNCTSHHIVVVLVEDSNPKNPTSTSYMGSTTSTRTISIF